MRDSTSCSPFRCQAAPYRVSAFGWFFIRLLSIRSILANLVPSVLFLGFGFGASWVPKARIPRGIRGHANHREICKIGLSKMQFPAFPGPELGNRKGLSRRLKMFTKKEIFDWFGNYQFVSCSFYSWFQNGLQSERVYESYISRLRELLSRDRLHQIQILSHFHCRSPHHHNRLQVPEQPLPLLPIIISFFFFRLYALHN